MQLNYRSKLLIHWKKYIFPFSVLKFELSQSRLGMRLQSTWCFTLTAASMVGEDSLTLTAFVGHRFDKNTYAMAKPEFYGSNSHAAWSVVTKAMCLCFQNYLSILREGSVYSFLLAFEYHGWKSSGKAKTSSDFAHPFSFQLINSGSGGLRRGMLCWRKQNQPEDYT